MTTFIILVIIVIAGSAFFSGLEAALFALPIAKVNVLVQQQVKNAKVLLAIKEKISRPITVIVICNNIINIVGSIFVGVVGADVFGNKWLGLISGLLTFLIIIFGEIIPKTIGENHAAKISLAMAKLLLVATKVLYPIVWVLELVTSRFATPKKIVSEEELTILSHLGSLEGSIEEDERDLIQKAFTLNDLTASEIMTPRNVVVAFQKDAVLGDIEKEILSLPNSRLPVYGASLDDVVGVCHRWDLSRALAKGERAKTINDFTSAHISVFANAKADALLPLFQKQKHHLAVVQDDEGKLLGVVTLEDVLEQLVGEIVDETDLFVDSRVESMRKKRTQKK